MLRQCRFEVDQHDHPELGRHARQRDEPDAGGDRLVVAQQVEQPDSAGQRERQRGHDQCGFIPAPERRVEQGEDDEQCGWHDDLQSLRGAFEELELTGIGHADSGRQLDLLRDCPLQIADNLGERTASPVDIDPCGRTAILAAQHRRAIGDMDIGNRPQRDLLARGSQHREVDDIIHAVADFAGVTHADRIAGQPFDGLPDRLAADRARHHRLHVCDVEAIARCCSAIDGDVDVSPAREPFGERGTNPRHGLGDCLDFPRGSVNVVEIGPRYLDPDRAFDPGGQHVDPVTDRRYPEVGEAGDFDGPVQLVDQPFLRHACAPLALWFEADRRLEHFERGGVGCRVGAACLAEHAFDFGHGLDEPVGLLEQHRGLGRRDSRQGRGHVEQIALIHLRHEFTASLADRPEAGGEHQHRDQQCRLGLGQHPVERGAIDARQEPVDRVAVFGGYFSPDQPAHQYRDQGDRQQRGARHRIGLGESERREQPPLLALQREDRDERERDDEQAEEQRRANFRRRIGNDAPARFARQFLVGVIMVPAFEVLVGVLNHHHRRIDHRADGDGDAAQREDVGV